MVLRILAVGLQQVVVDVLHGNLRARAIQSQRLQLQHDQGPGRVLGEGLVDVQADFGPRHHLPGDQVRCDEFLCDVVSHGELPYSIAVPVGIRRYELASGACN